MGFGLEESSLLQFHCTGLYPSPEMKVRLSSKSLEVLFSPKILNQPLRAFNPSPIKALKFAECNRIHELVQLLSRSCSPVADALSWTAGMATTARDPILCNSIQTPKLLLDLRERIAIINIIVLYTRNEAVSEQLLKKRQEAGVWHS